jgi:hypothetical protein
VQKNCIESVIGIERESELKTFEPNAKKRGKKNIGIPGNGLGWVGDDIEGEKEEEGVNKRKTRQKLK